MGQVDPNQIPRRNPRSIKQYLEMAKGQGVAPRFTNVQGGEGYNINQGQSMQRPQAIPEGPQSEYEMIPFSKRMKMDPYVRAQNRVQTMLPQMWEQMFPGMQQGSILDERQMQMWQGAVEKVTGGLLKQFEKQYEWSMKNATEGSGKDMRHWQQFYHEAVTKGNPPIDPKTGEPVSEAQFIQDRLDVANELKFKQEMGKKEINAGPRESIDDFTHDEVKQVLSKNPAVGNAIRLQIKYSLGQIAGREITDGEFDAMARDPQWRPILNEATRDALEQYQDRIIELYNKR
jgi:hypothetical protein